MPIEDDLRRTIRSGISGTAMPFFKDLSDDDVDALIVFIKSMSRNWDKEELKARPVELPEIPDWFRSTGDRKVHTGKGEALFATHCAVCHGAEGDGDGPGAKGLMDVWEDPVRPAILSEPHHKSGDSPLDLYRTIATGLNGTPMVGYVETLEPEEIWELVSFVQSLSSSREKGSTGSKE